jgi:hypothetical protein
MNINERMDILNNPIYKIKFNKNNFKSPDIFEFTHDGDKIKALFEPAYEEMVNGCICHRLNLINENSSVGYLKVFYLPKETFKDLFPDIIHWVNAYKGGTFGLNAHPKKMDTSDDKLWVDKTAKEKNDAILKIAMHISYGCYSEINEKIKNNSIDVEAEYQNLIKIMTIKHGKEFRNFKKTRIDKPIIDFSRIRDKNEKMNQIHWSKEMKDYCEKEKTTLDNVSKEGNISFMRKGLGLKMYSLMSDWLALNNLPLCKGGTNEMSTPLWEKKIMKDPAFNCISDASGMYIDHTQKDVSYLLRENKDFKLKTNLKIN